MISLLCAALLAQTGSVASPAQLRNLGFDPERVQKLSVRMKRFVSEGQIAGMVVLAMRDGKTVLFEAHGFADLEQRRPMRTDSIFQVMSMTKPITAIAVVQCVEDGLLTLDDPVSKFIPGFAQMQVARGDGTRSRPSRPITVRHLLTHTSGLPSVDPGGLTDEAKRQLTLAEYAARFGGDDLLGEPGEAIRYSGPGYAALGRIVEIASGERLENFLRRRLFMPLEMKDTTFFIGAADRPRLALAYASDTGGKLARMDEDPFREGARLANPAGGLYSTAGDMAAILRCLADGGLARGRRLLSPSAVESLTSLQTGSLPMDGGDGQGYALGFSVIRSAARQTTFKSIGTFGHTGAFGTEFWYDPGRRLLAVFMAQGFGEVDTARKVFATMFNAAYVGKAPR